MKQACGAWVVCLGVIGGLASCGPPGSLGFGLATTVVFDQSVDDATLARVSGLEVSVTGDETYAGTESLTQGAMRTERFVYRPKPSSRALLMAISAVDASGATLAAGESPVLTLEADQTTSVDIALHAGTVPLDDAGLPLYDGSRLADSGARDATYVDAAGGTSRCGDLTGSEGIIACQGFESSSEIGDVETINASIAIDSSRHFRGASSLKITTTGASTGAMYTDAFAWAEYGTGTPTELHTRAFIYLDAALPESTPIYSYLGDYSATDIALGLASDGALVMIAGFGDMGGPRTSATKVPLNTWTCLEFVFTPTTLSYGTAEVYMNEAHIADIDYKGPTESAFSSYQLGLGLVFNTATSYSVWFDELILATQQIGCEE